MPITSPPPLRTAREADANELRAIAESEGADEFHLHKKQLKTGREIWTLGGGG